MSARTADERKVATILFADLVGSTELSGRFDPEVMRAVMMRYFELLSATIERHGGTVEKFIGDAVMAVFGVPMAHENDVQRSLAAALDVRRGLAELNTSLTTTFADVRLRVRIGINTGEVVATRESSQRQVLVSGEAVNLAARLEQHADAEEILIGAATFAAAGAIAVTGDSRQLTVKGKDSAIVAYPLLDILPDDPETARRFDVPFVGRTRELATLDLVLDRVRTGGSLGMVLVHGDPGIGKTRLVTEWLSRTGVVSVSTRCRSYADDGSMRPLRDLVEQAGGADAEVICARPQDEAYAHAVEVFETTATRPLAIVIDDCHWASTVLLELIDRLADDLADLPVLLICAARRELFEIHPQLGRAAPNFSSIELAGMSADDLSVLSAAFEDTVAHDAGVAQQLVARAEGNPLHLEQLAAALRDGDTAERLPTTIRALIAARLDMLADSERALLEGAAVIGREFTANDVAALLDLSETDARRVVVALRALARRHLLEVARRDPARTHRFASGLIHEAVYAIAAVLPISRPGK